MRVAYPVIFTEVENNVLIEIPDLKILTEACDDKKKKWKIADAIEMARDAIGLWCITKEDEGMELPDPTTMAKIDIVGSTFYDENKSFVSMVDVDLLVYRQKNDRKMVRRNVTLPNWLNREAEAAHINVSRVLQEALMSKLNVYKN